MGKYKYEAETIEIMGILQDVTALADRIHAFSEEIETDDVNRLLRQMKAMSNTTKRIYNHLSSLNTKEDRETYQKRLSQEAGARKVRALLAHTNVLEYVAMEHAGITNTDIVAFQEYYNVRLRECGWGTWRWLGIRDLDGNEISSVEDFIKYGLRDEMPEAGHTAAIIQESSEYSPYDGYGFVAPDGTFIPSDWGTHEEKALELIKDHSFYSAYINWKHTSAGASGLARDYIINEKGFCLIHNPSMDGGYIVTCSPVKSLTKAQRETLYDYFTENGDSYLANQYIQENDYER